jgi:4-hydroxythreonine-4-phosphate dehydrogenase
MTSRHLAITMGDPAGIGPEIIVKACIGLQDRITKGDLRLLIIGSGAALEGAKAALGASVAIPQVSAEDRDWPNLCFLQADAEGAPIQPGVLSADGGRFRVQGDRAGRAADTGRPDRGHRHGAAEQGSAQQGRLPLSRAYRDAGASAPACAAR